VRSCSCTTASTPPPLAPVHSRAPFWVETGAADDRLPVSGPECP
jgi:hypothetical protein